MVYARPLQISLLVGALCTTCISSLPVEPVTGKAATSQEGESGNSSLPFYLPIPRDQRPNVQVEALTPFPRTYPRGELAHTYLSILDQLWQYPEYHLFQKPSTIYGTEFRNVGLRYRTSDGAKEIFTSVQATWATLDVFDITIGKSDRHASQWRPYDFSVGKNKKQYGLIEPIAALGDENTTAIDVFAKPRKSRRAGDDDDNLEQDLSKPVTSIEAEDTTLPASWFDLIGPASSNTTTLGIGDVSVRMTFTQTPIAYRPSLFQFRTFMLMAMQSPATGDIKYRWPRGKVLLPNPDVQYVKARMLIDSPKGLFPPTVTFGDITNAVKQILAECVKHGEVFYEFRAEIVKSTIVVAHMGMDAQQPTEAVASA